jgi:UPF0716 protein FxsA
LKTVGKIFLLISVVTVVELFLLLKLAEVTSWWISAAMVIVPGLVGAWLLKREGTRAFRAVREALGLRREPGGAILDGAIVLVAGTLLITPGVLSDLTGLALLLPPVRRVVREYARRRFAKALDRRLAATSVHVGGFEVIDADDIPRPR